LATREQGFVVGTLPAAPVLDQLGHLAGIGDDGILPAS